MIATPTGFTACLQRDGVLYTRRGDDVLLRYVERWRPVSSIAQLWGDQLQPDGPPVRLITDEGEYAWLLEGQADGPSGHLTRLLGAVVGDDFLAVLEATTRTPGRREELGDLCEGLLRGDRQLLGRRRRPYWYQPPPGWSTDHHAPFYTHHRQPDGDALVYVPPAIPKCLVSEADVLSSLGLSVRGGVPVHAALSGSWYRGEAGDGPGMVEGFVLEDHEYFYGAVAHTTPAVPVQPVLAALMRSIEPIPLPRAAACHVTTLWPID